MKIFSHLYSRLVPVLLATILSFSAIGLAQPSHAARIAAMKSMEARVPHNAKDGVSLDAVTRSVIAAVELNEWRPTFERPGVVLAEKVTHEGKHRATVKISYDTESFIIDYVSSHNLGYTAKHCERRAFGNPRMPKREPCFGPAIHPNYNAWLWTLTSSIYDHVVLLSPGQPGPAIRYILPGTNKQVVPALVADEIRKLKALEDEGILSPEEFTERKKLLLAR